MIKKIINTFIVLIILTTLSIWVLNVFFLPTTLKDIIKQNLEKQLKRPVEIASIQINPFQGIVAEDITVIEKDSPKTLFFSARKLSFSVLYWPFGEKKNIFFPTIKIEQPSFRIVRKNIDTWNFSNLLTSSDASQKKNNPSIGIGNLSIHDATFTYMDENSWPPLTEILSDVQINAHPSLKGDLLFSVKINAIKSSPNGKITTEGDFNPSTMTLNSRVHLQEISISRYFPNLKNRYMVDLNKGTIADANLSISWANETLGIDGKIKTKDIQIKTILGQTLIGDPILELSISYHPRKKEGIVYKGLIDPNGASINNLPYIKELKNIKGNIYLSPGKLRIEALKANTNNTRFDLSGSVKDFSTLEGNFQLKAETKLEEVLSLLPPKTINFDLKAQGPATFQIDYEGPLLSLNKSLLTGTLDVNRATVQTNKFPTEISEVTGRISYAKNSISWEDLSAIILDARIKSAGKITDLAQPSLDLALTAKGLDLSQIKSIFPEFYEKQKLATNGEVDLVLKYTGALASFEQGKTNLEATLKDVTIQAKQLPEKIKNMSGKILMTPESIVLENIKGNYLNEDVLFNSKITNLKQPAIHVNVQSKKFDVSSQIDWVEKSLKVNSFTGHYLDSSFAFKGDIGLLNDRLPKLNLISEGTLKLEDIPGLFPQYKETLTKMNPTGKISLQGSLRGGLEDWRGLEIKMTMTSPEIKLYGYRIQETSGTFLQQNHNIDPLTVRASFYGGALEISATSDLTKPDAPFLLNFNLVNTDLSRLKKDTVWQSQDISGFLTLSFAGNGPWANIKKLEGNGSVLMNEGHIGKLNLLEGLGRFIFIPEFENITFSEIKGDFKAGDNKLTTDNLYFKSEPATFFCRGSVDFDGNLSFSIYSQFSQETIANSPSLKKAITALLTQTENYLTVKLSGTLQNPKYLIIPSSVDMLDRTKNIILDGLQSIFE